MPPNCPWTAPSRATIVSQGGRTPGGAERSLRAHANLPLDRLLSAETVQRYKPNPAVYDMAISTLGVAAAEILMVAAHNYD
jgi:HAD superfamily hydrolase (TIGR01493 family)